MALGSGILLIGNITNNSLFQFKLGAIGDIGFFSLYLCYIVYFWYLSQHYLEFSVIKK
jgi:hypothetical protein